MYAAIKDKPLKWHGGKHYLAEWILSHFPNRDSYTHYAEPFAGGLSVLFAHDQNGKSETVNDLNRGLSDFWYVLANCPEDLIRRLWSTPLSEQVWTDAAHQLDDIDRVKRATAFFVRNRQSRAGLGRDYATPTRRTRRGMCENVSAWLSAVEGLPEAHERLKRVEVRSMLAIEFVRKYDHENAVFYCDPPYLHETRVTTRDYAYEMSLDDHARLLESLAGIKGMFLLSGYQSDLYDRWARDNDFRFATTEIDNKASSKKVKEKKTEYLWMNF